MYSSLEVDCRCAAWTYRVHTSHRGSRSEGGWNESQNEHPIVCGVESGPRFPCLRDTQMHAIHLRTCPRNRRLLQFLTGKDVNSFTPRILPVLDWQGLLFSRAVGPKFVSASKADTVPVSQCLRMRRNHERPRTRCNIFVPSSYRAPPARPDPDIAGRHPTAERGR